MGKRRGLQKQRIERVRLLSAELDNLRASALERTRSIDTKASFVVVAAGVIAAASFETLSQSQVWMVAILPVALTVATVVVSAVALWPFKLKTPSARDVVDHWVDARISPAELEDNLLEMKAVEVTLRNSKNESRGKATKWAFALLVASLVSALAAAGINSAISNGEGTDGETRISPTQTNSGTP